MKAYPPSVHRLDEDECAPQVHLTTPPFYEVFMTARDTQAGLKRIRDLCDSVVARVQANGECLMLYGCLAHHSSRRRGRDLQTIARGLRHLLPLSSTPILPDQPVPRYPSHQIQTKYKPFACNRQLSRPLRMR